MNDIQQTVALMRVHQWIKNGFVFAAPLFAKQLSYVDQFAATCFAFVAFCLCSSAVYIFNDLVDLERDRVHPTKKNRPLASGKLSKQFALTLMIVLVVLSCLVAFVGAGPKTLAVIAAYMVANILYSYALKYVVILDVAFIAVGFILRILAGAFATETLPSYWLILCTLNVSLFLGFAKRRGELSDLGENAQNHREVLEHYSEGFLDQMISIVTTSTLICYILYTVDDRTQEQFGTRALVLTVPFVMYGIFRYLYLTYHHDKGGSPTRAILMDPIFLVNGLLWGLSCAAVIYYGPEIQDALW